MKKFDLEAAKAGKKIITRDKRPAELLKVMDDKYKYNNPVIVLVDNKRVQWYYKNGNFISGVDTIEDLMMEDQNDLPATPVSVYIDENGQKFVRVRTLDEDFLLGIHDINVDGKTEFTWKELIEMGNKGGYEIPSKKQWSIIAAYKEEVNAAMKDAGGDELYGCYWSRSVAQHVSFSAWLSDAYYGKLYTGNGFSARRGRSLAYTSKN